MSRLLIGVMACLSLVACATKPVVPAFTTLELESASEALSKHVSTVYPPASTVIALSESSTFSSAVGAALRARGFGLVEDGSDAITAEVDLVDLGDGAMWVFNTKQSSARQRLMRENGTLVAASAVTVRE